MLKNKGKTGDVLLNPSDLYMKLRTREVRLLKLEDIKKIKSNQKINVFRSKRGNSKQIQIFHHHYSDIKYYEGYLTCSKKFDFSIYTSYAHGVFGNPITLFGFRH